MTDSLLNAPPPQIKSPQTAGRFAYAISPTMEGVDMLRLVCQ
jgi:hypothetical protein